MKQAIFRLLGDEKGSAALEYALIAAAIAIGIILSSLASLGVAFAPVAETILSGLGAIGRF